jgi:hypothetical protein
LVRGSGDTRQVSSLIFHSLRGFSAQLFQYSLLGTEIVGGTAEQNLEGFSN